jgi:hypothetical protein
MFNALFSAASKRAFESFAVTDHTMKVEGGAFTMTGGKATITVHIPLPPDHPMHSR